MYMQEKGCARWAKGQENLAVITADLLQHPEKLQAMSEASVSCHRDGARIIATHIRQIVFPDDEESLSVCGSEYSHESI